MQNQLVKEQTFQWLESVVIGLNLCPFARRELDAAKIVVEVSGAKSDEQLLTSLQAEFERLQRCPEIETILLVHPHSQVDFQQYNLFLGIADDLLTSLGLEGFFQIASFHPDYQFAGTEAHDAENYSNRSPYPMLHLLREESVERAIARYPDVHAIPDRNIALLKAVGVAKLDTLLKACFLQKDDSGKSARVKNKDKSQ